MLNYKIGDSITVYKKKLISGKIDKTITGTIIKMKVWKQSNGWGDSEVDCYKVIVDINNKKVKILDRYNAPFFRKYTLEI